MTDPVRLVKDNWQIVLLVVLLAVSAYFLFVPGAPISGNAADAADANGTTNLQYGIQLDGGARISAPVEGLYVEDVTDDPQETVDRQSEIRTEVAAAMEGVQPADVVVYTAADEYPEQDVVEVRAEGDPAQFVEGLGNAGFEVSQEDVQPGVTGSTREDIVEVLDTRLSESGFGGSATQSTGTGEPRIVVEAPGQDLDDLRGLIEERGLVQLVAHYPDGEGGYEEQELFRQDGIASQGTVQFDDQTGQPFIPVTLTPEAAENYAETMQETGFSTQGVRACQYDPELHEDQPIPDDGYGYCLFVVVDGERVWGGNLARGLAEDVNSGAFEQSRSFRMTTTEASDAQDLRLNLIAGELPAELNLEDSNDYLFNPALAEGFKTNSLLTGVIAVLAVVVVVFLRYGDPRVAAPMSATALSEVALLLGFVAAVGLPLDLAHVAGFIAVIGTGVDDLIIIADEVMSEGEVRSHHVFDSRFRKAFWVIGAAAATTIVAVSPLAVLELGDLRWFAIITILGVIVGVAITRPAYGNILRALKTEGQ